jgi:hypothetical protein
MILEAKRMSSKTMRWFGLASIVTGLSSFMFHMSYTYIFQIFDFFGIFCYGKAVHNVCMICIYEDTISHSI